MKSNTTYIHDVLKRNPILVEGPTLLSRFIMNRGQPELG